MLPRRLRELNSDWPTTIPARKAPKAGETPKSCVAPDGDSQCHHSTAEREQFPRPVRATLPKNQGITRPPDDECKRDQQQTIFTSDHTRQSLISAAVASSP